MDRYFYFNISTTIKRKKKRKKKTSKIVAITKVTIRLVKKNERGQQFLSYKIEKSRKIWRYGNENINQRRFKHKLPIQPKKRYFTSKEKKNENEKTKIPGIEK